MRAMIGSPNVQVSDVPERERFEAHVGGELVGIIDYIPRPGKVVATHTEVFEGREGQGIGSALVRGMLDLLRSDGRSLRSRCPYVTAYLERHPEENDVVDASDPRR